jgi:hypothetical protein
MSTNIGGGIRQAGGRFCVDDNPTNNDCDREEMREQAVWIAILLTDGSANAAIYPGSDPGPPDFSNWICPANTYDPDASPAATPAPGSDEPGAPWCKDNSSATRHADSDSDFYDADDYARDQADMVGCPGPRAGVSPPAGCPADGGVGAVIFTIGLGANVTDSPNDPDEPRAGEHLLRYIAAVGIDGEPTTDPFCSPDPGEGVSCGNYYFSPDGPGLVNVFEDIASRIFTRITH